MTRNKARKLGPPAQAPAQPQEMQVQSAAINGFVVLRFSTKVDEIAFTPEQAVRHAGSMQENALGSLQDDAERAIRAAEYLGGRVCRQCNREAQGAAR